MSALLQEQLAELGYGEGVAEVQRFQRDYNAMPPKRMVPVTGQLDSATIVALALVMEAKAIFLIIRDERGL
ncbi:hypothetical protein PPSIR1_21234 [Plesiocystis pacifica SIR-1]|uniref:Peptidoglycan binding-like domain-containing protein n=1 Tax=Plesiocystis pacifica SIR-1 TaxID=391625 RepID=A6G3I6_9BACT|nr:hypothetical protein [Plesiocystis pacifica]EDM79593.1 hypothetical protein PPSIR1_21234 [Plesiocystis pacifica SIR-1]